MIYNKSSIICCFLATITCSVIFGQRSDNSPYSRFGIGDRIDRNLSASRSMGSLSAAFLDPYNLNTTNPAALPYIYASSFEVGGNLKYRVQDDGNTNNGFWGGGLDYISLSFPLSNPINDAYEGVTVDKKWGMNIGLFRNSSVGYNISSTDSVKDVSQVVRNYSGQGGTYNFVVGTGYRNKNFSAGINLGYLFGNIKYEKETIFQGLTLPFNNDFSENYFIRGFSWKGGLMYTLTLNEKELKDNKNAETKKLIFGLSGNSATGFSTDGEKFEYARQFLGSTTVTDTISTERDVAGKGKLPAEFNFGAFYYSGEKYGLGFDVGYSAWSSYFNDANYEKINSLNNTFSVSFGGYFRPDYKSFTNFFKRVQYRYGVYYRQDARVVSGKQLDTYGLTLGMGLPFVFQRKFSNVNLGLDLGQFGRGTPVTEKYIKLNFGFNFNDDEWFIKRKYN
ncbi:MAG: hypothetical protein WAT92_16195 [Saprospiraceae bacterium]